VPDAAVAVIVTVPVVPPSVPEPLVEFCVVRLMTDELLELQFAATLEVKVTADDIPPLPERLMTLPDEQELQVIVRATAPTVTEAVPADPL